MIRVSDDYIIEVTEKNYIVRVDKHKLNKKGKPVYSFVGYYGALKSALQGIFKHATEKALSMDKEITLKDAINTVAKLETDLVQAIASIQLGQEA